MMMDQMKLQLLLCNILLQKIAISDDFWNELYRKCTVSDPIYHLVVIVPMRMSLWWTLGSVLTDWWMSVPWIPYLSLSGPVTLLPLGHLVGKLGITGNLPSHRSTRSHHGLRITVRSEWSVIIMGRRWRCILQPCVMTWWSRP